MQRGDLTIERGMVCYASPALRSAVEVAADKRQMPISQYLRCALLEAVAKDGVELKTAEQRR
jgi:hypothetical protein